MFDNIGGKIKGLAIFTTIVGIVACFIYGCIMLDDGGLLIMLFGPVASWLGSFVLYGFGQLVENSDKLVELATEKQAGGRPVPSHIAPEVPAPAPALAAPWNCPQCGEVLRPEAKFCARCGVKKPEQTVPDHPDTWTCISCNTVNRWRVSNCQSCGTSKAWSDQQRTNQYYI